MRNNKVIVKIFGILLFIIAIILIIVCFLRSNVTVVSSKTETTENTVLACFSTSTKYPFFDYDNTNLRELNIKLLFSENNLRSIALDYSLFYDNETFIRASEAHNRAAMNISYASNGLESDALSIKYAMLIDRMRTNLYATVDEIDVTSAKYFLINTETYGGLPKTLTDYLQNYAEQGINCEVAE